MLIATPTTQHSVSLSAIETSLLNSKKSEIWQLIYVQHQSEEDAYASLAFEEGSGRLGKQTFRETVSKWQRDEPEVWPARPGYWDTDAYVDDEVDCAYQSCKENIGLCDEVSRNTIKTVDWRILSRHEKLADDSLPHVDDALEQQNSSTDTPAISKDGSCNKISLPKSNNTEKPNLNTPLNSHNLSVSHSQEQKPNPQRSQAGSWLVSLALDPSALPSSIPYLLSQSIYCPAYTKCLSLDHDNNDEEFSEPLSTRDASRRYLGCSLVARRARNPVRQFLGFLLVGNEDEDDGQRWMSTDDDDDGYEYDDGENEEWLAG